MFILMNETTNTNILAFTRENGDKKVTFINNLSNKEQKFNAPMNLTVKHFISSIEQESYSKGEIIVLKPWKYFVLD